MKPHFTPVGKPAPPSPRRLDFFTSSVMRGRLHPLGLVPAAIAARLAIDAKGMGLAHLEVLGEDELGHQRKPLEDAIHLLRREQPLVAIVGLQHGRQLAGAEALDGEEGDPPVRGGLARLHPEAGLECSTMPLAPMRWQVRLWQTATTCRPFGFWKYMV